MLRLTMKIHETCWSLSKDWGWSPKSSKIQEFAAVSKLGTAFQTAYAYEVMVMVNKSSILRQSLASHFSPGINHCLGAVQTSAVSGWTSRWCSQPKTLSWCNQK
jgi:hypothetical protein